MPRDLIEVVAAAHRRGGVMVALDELIGRLEMEDTPLRAIEEIQDQIRRAGLELVPGLKEGGLETERFLRPLVTEAESAVLLHRELEAGEGSDLEFKGSLVYHRDRAASDRTASDTDLRSDAIIETAMKAICGLLNCEGGVLLIGVANDGSVVGVEDDYRYVGAKKDDTASELRDKWELFLRAIIRDRFYEGARVNDLVSVTLISQNELTVARLKIGRRKKLACIKVQGRQDVYLRRGNRTDRLEVYEIEDLVRERADAEVARRS